MKIALLYQRRRLWVQGPLALAAMAAILLLWLIAFPIPQARVRISTGLEAGIYHAYAQRYAQKFAEHGVQLELLPSAGSVENMARLARAPGSEGATDLALVQGGFGAQPGGYGRPGGHSGLQTLANVDLEPVWIFSRVREIDSPVLLQGLRVSIGPECSGSRMVALKLLEAARLTPADLVLSNASGMAAVSALRQGTLDVAIFVSAPESSVVNAMLSTPGIYLAPLKRTAALTERYPFLESHLLAQGMLDPAGRHPPQDMSLLATTASLVAQEDLHPAFKRLAASVAAEVHDQGGLFHKPGDFPNLRQLDFPAAPEARQTLLHGLPWIEQRLGFWWSQVLWRMLLIVLPVALLAWWLGHMVPAYFRWLLESRVNRWYGELKYIEHDLTKDSLSGLDLTKYHSRLQQMESAMGGFATPRELMQRFYILHQHIGFVRQQLHRLRGR